MSQKIIFAFITVREKIHYTVLILTLIIQALHMYSNNIMYLFKHGQNVFAKVMCENS